jgi:hypothetical protein
MKKKIRTVWKTDDDSVGDAGDDLHHRRMSWKALPFFVRTTQYKRVKDNEWIYHCR